MSGKRYGKVTRLKCLALRKQGMSLREVSRETGVSLCTVSKWYRGLSVSQEEKVEHERREGSPNKKDRGDPSKFFQVVQGVKLSRHQKAKIAESAILFRLCLHGFSAYGSVFDGDRADWIVETDEGKALRLQVKFTKVGKSGLPLISLRRYDGKGQVRYKVGDFDFIVGYDLFSDIAYVFSWAETEDKKYTVTIHPDAVERWDKLRV